MKERIIEFEPLYPDPDIFFFGTDQEIEEVEKKERDVMDSIRNIIFAPGFLAMEILDDIHVPARRVMLHHSTREEILFQISYMYCGEPTMHENYMYIGTCTEVGKVHDEEELLKRFTESFFHDHTTRIRLLTKK